MCNAVLDKQWPCHGRFVPKSTPGSMATKSFEALKEASETLFKFVALDEQDSEVADLLDDNRSMHGYHYSPYPFQEGDKGPWQSQVTRAGSTTFPPLTSSARRLSHRSSRRAVVRRQDFCVHICSGDASECVSWVYARPSASGSFSKNC
jgi:hypothetical protein